MTVAPGQRWKLPSGNVIQVIRFDQEEFNIVHCAPVIDGVLDSDKNHLLILSVRLIESGVQIR